MFRNFAGRIKNESRRPCLAFEGIALFIAAPAAQSFRFQSLFVQVPISLFGKQPRLNL